MIKEFSVTTGAREMLDYVLHSDQVRSQERVLDTVVRYAKKPFQEPLATFASNTQSLFDLKRFKAGSIFRVCYLYEGNEIIFHRWFATGESKHNTPPLYEIVYGGLSYNRVHAELRLTPGFHMTQIQPRSYVFPPATAHEAFGSDRFDSLFSVRQIDLMRVGVPDGRH